MDRLRGRQERSVMIPSIDQVMQMTGWYNGAANYFPPMTQNNKAEVIGSGFRELAVGAYAGNPIVFACMLARAQLFSEARFRFQRMTDGRPGELFRGPSTYLAPLEHPWPGGTTSTLLKDAITDADLGGNGFIARRPRQLQRLRPDWTVIIAGNPNSDATTWDLDTEILGFGYQPGGPGLNNKMVYLQREEVAHFRPIPDPLRRFSGMSWLVPVIREIMGDNVSTAHKLQYFENAATPNMAVSFDNSMTPEKAKDWIELFNKDHTGARNAYKTLFLGGGSTMQTIGANLEQADYARVQAGGELRIASAAGVPPIIVGLSGGLEAATYSNYGQARRAFADLTMRPLWRDMAGALEQIITVPSDARLWYDDRDISFLQEDMQDAAAIQQTLAATIRQMLDAGFTPESTLDAVTAQDFKRLQHSGLFSVQLQPSSSVNGVNIDRLIEQVKGGLITIDEARADIKLPPMTWDEIPSTQELLDQTKGGIISIDEARQIMGKPPMKWDDTPTPDDLLKQVAAGVMTHDEARALMGLPAMAWAEGPSTEEVTSLLAQVDGGLITHDEARAMINKPPIEWDTTPDTDELVKQLSAGLLTVDEAREVMGRAPMQWDEEMTHDEIGALIAKVEAGLLTHDEARAKMGLAPAEWGEGLSHDEVGALIAEVEAGLITHEEARARMGLEPAEWPEDLSHDEVGALIAKVESGLMTHDEAREVLKLQPMAWSEQLSKEETDTLATQVKEGLLTHEEARAKMGLPPIEWDTEPSAENVDAINKQITSGLLTLEEAREMLKRPPIEWPAEDNMAEKIEHLGGLIKAGFDPMDALRVLGLPPIKHLGLPPITLQKVADAEGIKAEPAPPAPLANDPADDQSDPEGAPSEPAPAAAPKAADNLPQPEQAPKEAKK